MSRPVEHDGVVYRREGSKFWWICYRDRIGKRQRESSFTEDWQQAHKMLRARLEARDGNVLQVVRKGESLSFGEWATIIYFTKVEGSRIILCDGHKTYFFFDLREGPEACI